MPRKAYVADLEAVSHHSHFNNISNVKAGADDGELIFLYQNHEDGSSVQISALIPDVSDYPKHHDFHVFAGEDAPSSVAQALHRAPSYSKQPIHDFLWNLSGYLNDSMNSQKQSLHRNGDMEIDDPDSQCQDGLDGDDLEEDDNEGVDNQDWLLDHYGSKNGQHSSGSIGRASAYEDSTLTRARADLRSLKEAGFKAGMAGKPTTGSSLYLSVSCRIRKLGISEEAMNAWHVDPSQYLILLINYPFGYHSLETLERASLSSAQSSIEMQVDVSANYKISSFVEAQAAFKRNLGKPGSSDKAFDAALPTDKTSGFHDTFISKPLTGLLNERLLAIIKHRLSYDISWDDAEELYDRLLNGGLACEDHVSDANRAEATDPNMTGLVASDEISTRKSEKCISFPLVAMQFLLRHFVRCTEFCLVCHRKLESKVEAIKPYVCEKPLCLYQYMNLGFGPSIEHEVITQPYVVDLLVSFCHAAAFYRTLNSYPEGLGLNVPPLLADIRKLPRLGGSLSSLVAGQEPQVPPPAKRQKAETERATPPSYECRLDPSTNELLFELDQYSRCPLRKGEWIMVESPTLLSERHCRVSETILFPTVKLGAPVFATAEERKKEEENQASPHQHWRSVKVYSYDKNFDKLELDERNDTILKLLQLLPSVDRMREHLTGTSCATLGSWTDTISPCVLSLLRWIISSNRSCIQQVDLPGFIKQENATKRTEERAHGLGLWLQFRFAMGAPDKEQRFLNAVSSKSEKAHPTVFAWHGSPLKNWHSIIREGLHYKQTAHGRAYGNGVYLSLEFSTSLGYSSMHQPLQAAAIWKNSILQFASAIALNEIVNAPEEFVSQSPFYVISQLDWIQTRYLCVLPQAAGLAIEEDKPLTSVLKQDPSRTPKGPSRTAVVLPSTAISKSRRAGRASEFLQSTAGSAVGKEKNASRKIESAKVSRKMESLPPDESHDDSDVESVDTQPEDLEIFFELDKENACRPASSSYINPVKPVTGFVVGPVLNLPLMPVPQYATSAASKRLQKDFMGLVSVQEANLKDKQLQNLGWYIYQDHLAHTDNLYQWVVALHSFPLDLPLAADMESAGVQSIVLEMRFHSTYPFSPPFVQVVRPRFLPFQNGGGGHITSGGSLCMDLLTSSGWTAAYDMESVLLQIRMAVMSIDPRPARLLNTSAKTNPGGGDYGILEAVEAFKRAARAHGWVVPDGLDELTVASRG